MAIQANQGRLCWVLKRSFAKALAPYSRNLAGGRFYQSDRAKAIRSDNRPGIMTRVHRARRTAPPGGGDLQCQRAHPRRWGEWPGFARSPRAALEKFGQARGRFALMALPTRRLRQHWTQAIPAGRPEPSISRTHPRKSAWLRFANWPLPAFQQAAEARGRLAFIGLQTAELRQRQAQGGNVHEVIRQARLDDRLHQLGPATPQPGARRKNMDQITPAVGFVGRLPDVVEQFPIPVCARPNHIVGDWRVQAVFERIQFGDRFAGGCFWPRAPLGVAPVRR